MGSYRRRYPDFILINIAAIKKAVLQRNLVKIVTEIICLFWILIIYRHSFFFLTIKYFLCFVMNLQFAFKISALTFFSISFIYLLVLWNDLQEYHWRSPEINLCKTKQFIRWFGIRTLELRIIVINRPLIFVSQVTEWSIEVQCCASGKGRWSLNLTIRHLNTLNYMWKAAVQSKLKRRM